MAASSQYSLMCSTIFFHKLIILLIIASKRQFLVPSWVLYTVGLNVDLGSFFELAELLDRNELMDA